MATELNDRRARYIASAAQTDFDVDFDIEVDTDVEATQKIDATGEVKTLVITTDYTIALDGIAPNTAVMTLVVGAAVGDIITVEGQTPVDREEDFSTGGDYRATVVNNAEDRQYRIAQERQRDQDRTVVANPVSPDTFDPTLPDVVGNSLFTLRVNAGEDGWEFVFFDVDSINQSVIDADAAAAAALVSENNSATSETSAGISATNAADSAAVAQAAAAGIRWKDRVLTSTTGNISLTGEQTIDGILTSASRVLVKSQTAPAENGVYVTAAGAWSRSADADTFEELVSLAVAVEQGTTQEDTLWICTSDTGGTLETSAVVFVQFGAGGMTATSTDTMTNKTYDANGTGNVISNIDIGNAIAASQAEAEAGIENTKLVTSLRVAEAIAALGVSPAFESELLHVRDEKTSGTNGGSSSSGVNTRVLNTVKTNEITGASLATNQITLAAGTYWLQANAPCRNGNTHKAYLYNTSDAADEVIGTSEDAPTGSETRSFVHGRFTIAAAKVFELRHHISTASASTGLGGPTTTGQVEGYAEAMFWKVG